jgi:hypothetical protein
MTDRPPSLKICDRNGSGVQTASTCPLFSAERICGNGMAVSLAALDDIPSFSNAALIMISPTPLSAFTATVFPRRSCGV